MFWSEIGSGFGEPGGTALPRILRSTPLPPGAVSGGVETNVWFINRVDNKREIGHRKEIGALALRLSESGNCI